ncbi:thiamine-monophosphate kinase [Naumannella cuiyingiana]|uniref:Thiamine-monophosphate kinase n=1 Tax=Naumannella cuiyingiana TaxID=1347891 RepID=A0A7Z0DBY8_9ACTN|nr:thiamine-monophosphate kinase [Naumannella cuiyingiana]
MSSDSAGPTIAEIGEFGLIDQVLAGLPTQEAVRVGPGDEDAVRVGPGDDGAVIDFSGPVVCSTDTMVEGVHFRRDWSWAHEVGRKAAAVNLADIEAMGARPVALLVAFSAPPELPASWARQCSQGLAEEAAAAGAVLVGGDMTRSGEVTIAVTALGTPAAGGPVLRSGARPGQVIALRGRVGWAAAGLVVLSRGFRSPRAVVEAQKVPQVPYGAGAEAAAAGAGALIDVSDGLLADLGHIADASDVTCDVDTGAFEVPDPLRAVAAATGSDPLALMLTGGEDHALAATFDEGRVPEGWLVIGRVRDAGPDGPGVLVDGAPWEEASGYEHFRR